MTDNTVDIFGLHINDLQTSVAISSSNVLSGTLNNIDASTHSAFYSASGFDASAGTNFLTLKATSVSGATIKCKFNGTTHTLDSDGIMVMQMTEAKKSQSVEFTTTKDGDTNKVTLALSGLTLAE